MPCSTDSLAAAINNANNHGGATLTLPAHCTFSITAPSTVADGLPLITASIALLGGPGTVNQPWLSHGVPHPGHRGRRGAPRKQRCHPEWQHCWPRWRHSVRGHPAAQPSPAVRELGGQWWRVANISGGTANIYHTVFDRNTTTGVGGGGIINSGTMTLLGNTLSGNTAPINGGGLNTQASGKSDIVNSAFDHNVPGGLGGAISNLGTTSLTVSVVQFNTRICWRRDRHRVQTSPCTRRSSRRTARTTATRSTRSRAAPTDPADPARPRARPGPRARSGAQSLSGRIGAATSDGSLRQSTPGTSTYSSISLPSGSVMYRLCVMV